MIRQKFSVLAIAVGLLATATISASAQTAGGSLLEQVSHFLKDSYAFGINSEGTSLMLRNSITGTEGITIDVRQNFLVMQSRIGTLSTLSGAKKKAAQEAIMFLNTTLPIGTLVIGSAGDIVMEHHIDPSQMQASAIVGIVNRFTKEAARQRASLFS